MKIALRCDCSPTMGTGHVIRSLALAEEFLARGDEVVMLGSTNGMAWPEQQIAARGLRMMPAAEEPDAFVAQLRELGVDAVDLDGYELAPELGRALLAAGIPAMTMVDGPFGLHQHADLYVDQNYGAVQADRPVADSQMLAGIEYALLRNVVLDRRDAPRPEGERPRVLVVFGGSDPWGGARAVVPLILAAVEQVEIIAIAANPEIAAELSALPVLPGQQLEVVGLVDDLPGLATTCTAAISAAGTSIWEFLCLGVPTGLVAVTENQLVGYREVQGADLIVPVGELAKLDGEGREPAIEAIAALLTDRDLQRRLSANATAVVDGRGRARVADALSALVPCIYRVR
ncbi:PseG/SpsG family protein [Enemella sp. A6]|uniref:PseG/SpsG family protein n=1 Tax=Enemella sp. A6 TaxID=3440152 RepID=UPI003EB8D503